MKIWARRSVAEGIGTFFLVLIGPGAVMANAYADGAVGHAGIAVGLTVGFCAMMGGPLTGASMNPARSLGPAMAGGIWSAHWLYWLAPITAMVAAAKIYDFLRAARVPEGVPEGVPMRVQGPLDEERRRTPAA